MPLCGPISSLGRGKLPREKIWRQAMSPGPKVATFVRQFWRHFLSPDGDKKWATKNGRQLSGLGGAKKSGVFGGYL